MHPKDRIDHAISEAVAAALEPSQRHRKRADSGGSDEPYPVDHDDLLALLERPRPHHGDLRALLRRASSMGQAEKTRKQADVGIPISSQPCTSSRRACTSAAVGFAVHAAMGGAVFSTGLGGLPAGAATDCGIVRRGRRDPAGRTWG
jgi:hypothetical protein